MNIFLNAISQKFLKDKKLFINANMHSYKWNLYPLEDYVL